MRQAPGDAIPAERLRKKEAVLSVIAMPKGPFGSGLPRRPRKSTPRANKPRVFDSIEHLSAEAVAGFVDNELPKGAMHRARVHLVHCAECRAEVAAQRRAADRLRRGASEEITAPDALMARLASIAQGCPEGPKVDDLPAQRGENFIARVETFYRAVKRAQGK